jgi:hypothetical protein
MFKALKTKTASFILKIHLLFEGEENLSLYARYSNTVVGRNDLFLCNPYKTDEYTVWKMCSF